jgi:hypothetical protein
MILVTGGVGFIGCNFVLDWVVQQGEPVTNLDKLTYAGNMPACRLAAAMCSYRAALATPSWSPVCWQSTSRKHVKRWAQPLAKNAYDPYPLRMRKEAVCK